jgi:hypothetical protein
MTMGGGANRFEGIGAMENDVVETDEDILTLDIPDEALERAAVVTEVQVTTIGVCTHWYHCSWPQ